MSQYIGKTISLVSNSNIRYVGTLHEINSEQSTVSLKQVRSYGTEGRLNGINEIPPSDGVYEFIVFRGSDVKDLKIAENPAPAPQQPFTDPAIIQAQDAHAPYPTGYPGGGFPPAPQNYSYPPQPQQQAPPAQAQPQQDAQPKQPEHPAEEHNNKENEHHKQRRHSHGHNKPHPKVVPTSEFNFDESNAKFAKESSESHAAEFYNKKSSFFDNISSTARERIEGTNDAMTGYQRRGEERKLNMETFGQPAVHHRGRGRGGYRGRGRGGRGGHQNGRNQNFQQQQQYQQQQPQSQPQ
ncbi:protein Scd6p [Trichomonascus vanleenenianus]|uniref:Scd6p n=1 Tax=Trichomonascus vanleenenianus TaxID=2268995 RepID=UPI003ECACB72